MEQLTALDAQFLNVESPTTFAHIGTLIVLDPATAPGGRWGYEAVRDVLEQRMHLAKPFRRRLVEVPLGLGFPYWVDDEHFDIEFHVRELALPSPGTREELGEQVARIHSRPLDRRRPLWEAYVITGLEGGGAAFYAKIHHSAIDGISGAEVLEAVLDITPEPREVLGEEAGSEPEPLPSTAQVMVRGLAAMALNPLETLRTVPRSLPYVDRLLGAVDSPGTRWVTDTAALVGRLLGQPPPGEDARELRAPPTPLNGQITAHRRFAFGSVPLTDVKRVRHHFGLTVNDVAMALATSALRRWLLDHDGLPSAALVAAIPVSIRVGDQEDPHANQMSVMLAELPTHVTDPAERVALVARSTEAAKRDFNGVPASLVQDLSALVPTAPFWMAAKALFRLAMVQGPPFNLFVSNVPGPQLPLYVAGARVEGIYPASAVTDITGGLNITVFSYDGSLDFGLIACREMVPDVWNLIGYLRDALEELLGLVESGSRHHSDSGRDSGRDSG